MEPGTSSQVLKKYRYWQKSEIKTMLTIIKNGNDQKVLMRAKWRSNLNAVTGIASMLTEKGFPRTAEQVRSKFTKLRQSFYRFIIGVSGECQPGKKKPSFYNEMNDIWGSAGKPDPKLVFRPGATKIAGSSDEDWEEVSNDSTSVGSSHTEVQSGKQRNNRDTLSKAVLELDETNLLTRNELEKFREIVFEHNERLTTLENQLLDIEAKNDL